MRRGALHPAFLLAACLIACGPRTLTPADVPNLKPGSSVKVHVWPPGTPGPGHWVNGTYQSQDAQKIVVVTKDKQTVEILLTEIHDDSREPVTSW